MTSPRSRFRLVGTTLVLAVLATACGLKPAATDSLNATANGSNGGANALGSSGVPGVNNPGNGVPGVNGNVPGATGNVPGSTGNTGNNGSTGNTGNNGNNNISQPPATGGACQVPHGGSTVGITATRINLGLHAPLTGTGLPFPNSSFQRGSDIFWEQPGHTVCGRKVQVEFQDDTYTPAGARQVCGQMAQRDFFVVGGGGTDQIQACATQPTIDRNDVPYLSAGVTDNGMVGLQNYFAVSLTYQQQGTLVLRNAQQQGFANAPASKVPSDNIKGKGAQWAIVTGQSPNFAGARNGMMAALNAAGIAYKNYPVDQNGDYQTSATNFGKALAENGFKVIFVDAAPGYYVFMTGGYYQDPKANIGGIANWVSPGVTYTEVTVAQYICNTSKSAISAHAWALSPAPGIDRATPDFKAAYNNYYDDIEWALWGLSKTLFSMLKNASANLTRQNFIASAEQSVIPANGIYPPVSYKTAPSPYTGHFGGTGAWSQRVNCAKSEPDQHELGAWDTVGSTYLRLY